MCAHPRSVAIVAQLVRASVCGTEGRGFKSRRSPHLLADTGQTFAMDSLWDSPDFDAHELVHFVTDRNSGLRAIIAVHSRHLGPAAGGTRFWHYAETGEAVADALRLSRGMSFKNAMAGLPMGGGKAVILADEARTKTPDMLAAYGKAIEGLCGAYVTAEDVGISVADLVAVAKQTRYVSGLPVASGKAGGDPGPYTSYGVFLGVKAAVKRKLG